MNPLQKAIDIVNGQSALAREITNWLEKNGSPRTVKQQNVWKWLNHSSGVPTVPVEFRLPIEEITNKKVTVIDLSHDIYGSPNLAKQENNSEEAA